jgi:uncharacterized protein
MSTPLSRLSNYLTELGPVAVAVSGGVDSMTLAVLSHRVNPDAVMFHAISPAVPRQATERVRAYARQEKWCLEEIDAGEIVDPQYLANPANRCYFCKTNLYDSIVTSAIVARTSSQVISGTNLDDLSDYRPGLIAAKEHQVMHPYVECQINKATLRGIATELGLADLQDLPAAPCLSSRVETGIEIDPTILPVINDVEQAVREYLPELTNVRCRVRQKGIVLELDQVDQLSPTQQNELIQLTQRLFAATKAPVSNHVTLAKYQQGSAFLTSNLAVDITPPATP